MLTVFKIICYICPNNQLNTAKNERFLNENVKNFARRVCDVGDKCFSRC